MQIIKYPAKEQWKDITGRPHLDISKLNATVSDVLADVKQNGDDAVRHYEQMFDHATLDALAVSEVEIQEALQSLDPQLMDALRKVILGE